jgi:hypothetical protein
MHPPFQTLSLILSIHVTLVNSSLIAILHSAYMVDMLLITCFLCIFLHHISTVPTCIEDRDRSGDAKGPFVID